MEAMVTISLKEVERLKGRIVDLENEVDRLQQIKEPINYVRVHYDFSKGTGCYNNFGIEVINEDNVNNEFENIVKRNFENVLVESIQNRFYNSFPKWVHKLFGY